MIGWNCLICFSWLGGLGLGSSEARNKSDMLQCYWPDKLETISAACPLFWLDPKKAAHRSIIWLEMIKHSEHALIVCSEERWETLGIKYYCMQATLVLSPCKYVPSTKLIYLGVTCFLARHIAHSSLWEPRSAQCLFWRIFSRPPHGNTKGFRLVHPTNIIFLKFENQSIQWNYRKAVVCACRLFGLVFKQWTSIKFCQIGSLCEIANLACKNLYI